MEKLCLFVKIIYSPRCVFYSEDYVNFIELQCVPDSSNQAYPAVSSYLCSTNNQQEN